MRSGIAESCVGLGLVLLLGCAGGEGWPGLAHEPSVKEQRVAEGRELFETSCAACHGVDADGGGPVAPYLDPKPPDLRLIAARRAGTFPQLEIEQIIDGRSPIASHGTRQMPVWGASFSEETEPGDQMESRVRARVVLLVNYLESIQVR